MRRAVLSMAAWATLSFSVPLCAQDAELAARAAIETEQPFVGQTLVFQIQVEGADSPERPDVSALRKDFAVQEAGGAANNSQSITIVNGRVTRNVQRGFTFQYQLTPKHEGAIVIPPITVRADGRSVMTAPLQLRVSPPAEIQDFRLIQTLSKKKVYVGEPVMLTTTWYVGRNVDQFAFTMPLLDDPRFEVFDPRQTGSGSDTVDVPVGESRVAAKKGKGRLDGWEIVTVEFRKAVVARQPGRIDLEPTVVSFRAIRASAQRPRSLFDDFFGDSFFGSKRGYEHLAIPSNPLALDVLPLPEEGRPASFSGLIGNFRFQATATPSEVSVGDPITLTIRVSGPEYLDYVRLPDLAEQQELAADFKIPEEMAAGEIVAGSKVFSQTIRAKDPRIQQIPSLGFSYFDPEQGAYVMAHTDAIPLEVSGTRVLTLSDAEGSGPDGVVQAELESAQGGIAHNYEDPGALIDRSSGLRARLGSPLWVAALGGPPAIYLGLLALVIARRRRAADPATLAARAALDELASLSPSSEGAFAGDLLERLQAYLRARLNLPPGALTFEDVRRPLEARGVGRDILNTLRDVFSACEAARYTGGALRGATPADLHRSGVEACRAIERVLGSGR
jgi:hypothetical protein